MSAPGTAGFRWTICRHETLGSTNEEALAAAVRGAPEGAVIVADRQTAGRGRRGRPWVSPPGVGLYASLLLRPGGAQGEELTLLPLLAGVAAVEAIREASGGEAGLKWPNDVLLNGRKVAGILVEAEDPGPSLPQASDAATSRGAGPVVVLGLGVNVTTSRAALPLRSLYPATSLLLETGRRVDRALLLGVWLERVATWYGAWTTAKNDALRTRWSELNALRGRSIRVAGADGAEVRGIGDAVDEQGALLVRVPSGKVTRVVAGDVRTARRRSSCAQC